MEIWLQSNIYFDRDDPTKICVQVERSLHEEDYPEALELFHFVAFTFRQFTNLSGSEIASELSSWLEAVSTVLVFQETEDHDQEKQYNEMLTRLLDEVELSDEVPERGGKRFEARIRLIEVDNDTIFKLDSWPKGFPLFGFAGNVPYHAVLAVRGLLRFLCEGKDSNQLMVIGAIVRLCNRAYRSGELNVMNQLDLAYAIVSGKYQ